MQELAVLDPVRDAILDAADRLLSLGYRKMTVEDLAREAGIGKGSVYLHFSSKEEVALSTIDRLVERLTVRLREIAAGRGSPEAKLREMLVTRVLFRFDHRRHDSKSMDEILSSLRLAFLARREKHFAKERGVLAGVLEEGRSRGVFGFQDVAPTAHALVLATNSLLPGNLSPRELGSRKRVAGQAAMVASILVRGLSTGGAAATRPSTMPSSQQGDLS